MAGKILCNRERDKQPEQILKTSLLDKYRTDFEDMATTVCDSQQDTVGDSTTKGIFKDSNPHTKNASVEDISSLHFHIRALYAVIGCLTVVLVPSLIFCYLEISSLRDILSRQLTVGGLVDFKFPVRTVSNDVLQMPYISSEDELGLGGFWESGEFTDEYGAKPRSKRHASFHEGSGASDEWLWMSSFARVPIVALQSYCKEAQLYCAAAGKPGPPGPKGETGEKGEKGDLADQSSVAASLANIETIRGPPGPKGENGADGPPGPMGPFGAQGLQGVPGNDGINGYPGPAGLPGPKGAIGPPGKDGNKGMDGSKGDRGPMGPQGDRGTSGLPGVPGLKGLQGDIGPQGISGMPGYPGSKGEPGYCHEGCDDREKTRTSFQTSTPVPTFPTRVKECSIEVLGMPVFQHVSTSQEGAWMKDLKQGGLSKIWVTNGVEGNSLLEYSSIDKLQINMSVKEISLSASPYFGTGHVVYDGHFYYHWAGTPKIVRFDLTNGQATTVRIIPDMIYTSATELKSPLLYQSKTMSVNFNVDQNGLWIIYGSEKHKKITVALLNTENLDIINSVITQFEPESKGGAFIACGKLYTLKLHNRMRTYLDEEYDLWQGNRRQIRIAIKSPYAAIYMFTYDPNNNQIYSWDGGRMLSLPLLLKSS